MVEKESHYKLYYFSYSVNTGKLYRREYLCKKPNNSDRLFVYDEGVLTQHVINLKDVYEGNTKGYEYNTLYLYTFVDDVNLALDIMREMLVPEYERVKQKYESAKEAIDTLDKTRSRIWKESCDNTREMT